MIDRWASINSIQGPSILNQVNAKVSIRLDWIDGLIQNLKLNDNGWGHKEGVASRDHFRTKHELYKRQEGHVVPAKTAYISAKTGSLAMFQI